MKNTHRIVIASLLVLASLAGSAAAVPPDSVPRPAPRRVIGVQDSPGWVPPADPESASVRTGRRKVGKISMPLRGGRRSLHALAEAIVAGLHARTSDPLFALCVTREEFSTILWPEFPQSRPITGWSADDAWMVLHPRLIGGTRAAHQNALGHRYRLLRVEITKPAAAYTNFRLHDDPVLIVADEFGNVLRMNWVRSIVERKGVFKVYSVKD